MAGFLYYRPGIRNNNRVTLAEAQEMGLGYAFSTPPASREVRKDGKAGYVFADESRLAGRTLGLYEEEQEWRKVPGRDDGLEVGYYKDAPPTPDDLERPATLKGYVVPLGAHKWTVPLVRDYDAQAGVSRSALPCYIDLDEQGEVCQGQVLEVYRHLWDLTEPYADAMLGGEDGDTDAEESDISVFDAAVKLLQTNYVIDKIEAVQLKMFSTQAQPTTVLLCAIDYGTFVSWLNEQEKKSNPSADDGLITSNGEAA